MLEERATEPSEVVPELLLPGGASALEQASFGGLGPGSPVHSSCVYYRPL